MNITIPSITIPQITLPLWAAILIGYAIVNFILWQLFIGLYGYDLNHPWLERLNPLQLLVAWISILFYLLW